MRSAYSGRLVVISAIALSTFVLPATVLAQASNRSINPFAIDPFGDPWGTPTSSERQLVRDYVKAGPIYLHTDVTDPATYMKPAFMARPWHSYSDNCLQDDIWDSAVEMGVRGLNTYMEEFRNQLEPFAPEAAADLAEQERQQGIQSDLKVVFAKLNKDLRSSISQQIDGERLRFHVDSLPEDQRRAHGVIGDQSPEQLSVIGRNMACGALPDGFLVVLPGISVRFADQFSGVTSGMSLLGAVMVLPRWELKLDPNTGEPTGDKKIGVSIKTLAWITFDVGANITPKTSVKQWIRPKMRAFGVYAIWDTRGGLLDASDLTGLALGFSLDIKPMKPVVEKVQGMVPANRPILRQILSHTNWKVGGVWSDDQFGADNVEGLSVKPDFIYAGVAIQSGGRRGRPDGQQRRIDQDRANQLAEQNNILAKRQILEQQKTRALTLAAAKGQPLDAFEDDLLEGTQDPLVPGDDFNQPPANGGGNGGNGSNDDQDDNGPQPIVDNSRFRLKANAAWIAPLRETFQALLDGLGIGVSSRLNTDFNDVPNVIRRAYVIGGLGGAGGGCNDPWNPFCNSGSGSGGDDDDFGGNRGGVFDPDDPFGDNSGINPIDRDQD